MNPKIDSKSRIVYLNSGSGPNPWQELGIPLPSALLIEGCALTKTHEWSHPLDAGARTVALIVDVDDLTHTKNLDEWSTQAWRATFNELVARCTNPDGKAPLLLAYTREPTWESAVLSMRLGARDIVKLSNLNDRIAQLFLGEDSSQAPSNVIEFAPKAADPAGPAAVPRYQPYPIPKHAIPFPIEGLEGTSAAIEVVRNIVRKSSPLGTPVLIVGPTGTGKELVAQCIHRYSERGRGPFIPVNCGAISPALVEAELFGHTVGAFTGAVGERPGYLASANGGSLFLDEVSELPLDVQAKLLRALQEKVVTPVGSSTPVTIDIRILSASKEDLGEKVREGTFREDLLYRLRVMEITLPSLSERKSDIPEISKTILKKLARRHRRPVMKISDQVLEKFLLHRWPGNIRELENALEHAATLGWAENRTELFSRDLPETIQSATMAGIHDGELKEIVRRFEREYIASTVRRLGGSKEQAAEVLGLSLATLYRKLGSAS